MTLSITIVLIGIFVSLFFMPDFKMFKKDREWWSMFFYFTLIFLTVALVFQLAILISEFFHML